ncbi:MAG: MBL fold metallo-hydrolase [bacterium]|nr:MBL fold metallo-hydrolase [bacterium]
MVKEILPDLYKVDVPIPKNPLKSTNSYVIKGGQRDLIIDTGMNIKESHDAITAAFKELDVDLTKSDFFITHLHADHLGLISVLAKEDSTVFFNKPDADLIMIGGRWEVSVELFLQNGFPVENLQKAFKDHPGYRYASRGNVEFTIVRERDEICIGDYTLKVVETPGHTDGHTCLYDSAKKLLISGDHVLQNITPNIAQWFYDSNPLKNYLESLDKISEYDVDLVLPGHRKPFKSFKKRISEIKDHHRARADEVLEILKAGTQNSFEIASQMTWDLSYKDWEMFPIIQKMFATGEAIAHLSYLKSEGYINRSFSGDRFLYSLKK